MSSILALDVGESRIGVAVANTIARLPRPLTTLDYSDEVWSDIRELATVEEASTVVVGLPRNLSGEDTAQTAFVRDFVKGAGNLTIILQDEALTSKKAKAELNQRGKPYTKGDVDALAATYILEDYLLTHREVRT